MKGTEGVTIVTCTNRPDFFANILENYRAQLHKKKELIIVLNKDSMKLAEYRRKAAAFRNVAVYRMPEKATLGQCLNFGLSKMKYAYAAKFDDDDYYSPYYLTGQMQAMKDSGADLVGKRAYLAYLESRKLLILRFPEKQNRMVRRVAGGTLLFRKRVLDKVRFGSLTVGEDVDFLDRCRKAGFRLYAPGPYNYVQIRRGDKSGHTWRAGDGRLMKGSRTIARTRDYRRWAAHRSPYQML
ncbi:glycosyltransferase [Paenibacillus sp. CC-CFT747]|nr:glycosyltransferase [Paenibacillus sp. CC-CFT747]